MCKHTDVSNMKFNDVYDYHEPSQQPDHISFTADVLETVRNVAVWKERRFELDSDIRALGARVKAFNIAFVPLVVIVLSVLYFRRRGARRRQAAAA